MSMSGALLADFSSFTDECKRAVVSLQSFEEGSTKVEGKLNRISDSFSGQKIIQEATMMAEIFQRAGNGAGLTERELARMTATGGEAVAKLTALGLAVPPGIQKIADASINAEKAQRALLDSIGESGGRMEGFSAATTGAAGPVSTLSGEYRKFDGILQSLGINIGPHIKGLEDITNASIGGASGFMKLGLGVASGLAAFKVGWDFGKWLADITGLDKAVLGLADRWAGLDAATAGAKLDVINRAIANGAKETINYNEAIKFNIKHVQDQADAYAVGSERLAAAQKEVRGLSAATIAAIEVAQKNGATTEQITRHFNISADALKALADRQKLAGQAADAHTKELEKQRAVVEKLDADYAKLMSDVKNANQLAIMEADATAMAAAALKKKNDAAAGWIASQVAMTKNTRDEAAATAAYLTEQEALTAATDALSQKHTEAGAAAGAGTDVAVQGYQGVAQQVQITGDAIKEWIALMKYSAQVNAILSQNSLFTTTSQYQQIAALSAPSFAVGGPVTKDGPIYAHAGEYVVPKSAGGRGGASPAPITVNISTMMGNPAEIARLVREALVDAARSSGQRLPVGA